MKHVKRKLNKVVHESTKIAGNVKVANIWTKKIFHCINDIVVLEQAVIVVYNFFFFFF